MTEKQMRKPSRARQSLVVVAIAVLALTTVVPQDAFARAPAPGTPAQAKALGDLTEVSAARKQRRRVVRRGVGGHRAAAAMFGMMAGTIGMIAAAEARRGRSYYYVPDYPVYEEVPETYYYPYYDNGNYPYYEPYYDGTTVYGGPTYIPGPIYRGGGGRIHRPRHVMGPPRIDGGPRPIIGRPGPVFRQGAPARIGGGGIDGPVGRGPGGGGPGHIR